MDILQVWKRIGETPLQALERAKIEYRINKKGCYTGRLDPMAQGCMTLLFGDQVHKSQTYNSFSKTYRFQAILGVSTTSYDPLGRITNVHQIPQKETEQFLQRITALEGDLEQTLPPYSAYRYQGKPLWMHATAGTLPYPLPTKSVKVYNIRALHTHPTMVSLDEYRRTVLDDIDDMINNSGSKSAFDYEGIISDWNDIQSGQIDHFYRISLEADVSSGTFVRALVNNTAAELGIPAHAFRITRTRTYT